MSTNPAAAALGKLRWAGTTKTERVAAMDALRAAQTMTPDQRRERAKKAAAARWKGHRKKKIARRKS